MKSLKTLFLEILFIQERGGVSSFTHGSLALKYKLDNEFELVFVVSTFILNIFKPIKWQQSFLDG